MPDEPGERGEPGGRVGAAAAELYGADLDAFTDRRKALAAAARSAGDRSAATAIAALRKPTRAAWVVNRLARSDPGVAPRLAALAAALRAAEQARDGPRLRELSLARGALLDALSGQALAAAGLPDAPPGLRAEIEATLTAALADPEVGAAFAAGRLTRAEHWSGFGSAGLGSAGLGAAGNAPATPERERPGSPSGKDAPGQPESAPAPVPRPAPAAAGGTDRGTRRAAARGTDRAAAAAEAAAPQAAAARERLARERLAQERLAQERSAQERSAREAAERAVRDRESYQAAERAVAAAATAAAEALGAEDRLEAEVRDLEERLIRARAELTAARLTARRAEAAERRARQARDRRPSP